MKPVDHIRQRILGMTKKQFQIVKHPHRFHYFDESMFNLKRRYV